MSTEGQVGIVTNVTASGHFEVEFAVGYPFTHLRDLEASEVRLLRRGEACAGMRACGKCRSCITNGPPIWRHRMSSCIQTCFVALRRMAEALETPADVLTAMTAALGPSQEALDEVEARGWTVHAKEREVAAAKMVSGDGSTSTHLIRRAARRLAGVGGILGESGRARGVGEGEGSPARGGEVERRKGGLRPERPREPQPPAARTMISTRAPSDSGTRE